MCGIAGLVLPRSSADSIRTTTKVMGQTLLHRGPDAGDHWFDFEAGLGFAHRRLSIVDLSTAGAQPMVSASGRFVICYNGEVYNHAELRAQLETKGHVFKGHSDTEVIVEGVAEWGIDATLERLVGMFAIALWDRKTRKLTLARDRLGIKPVYWGQLQGGLIFGSELKALRVVDGFDDARSQSALAGLLRHNYIGGTETIYESCRKLAPGHVLSWSVGDETPSIYPFWTLEQTVEDALTDPFQGSREAAEDLLHDTLMDAVGCRMLADVPLGAFLSGGIDSSTVVALMQAQSDRPVKTFSIGFDVAGFDEAQSARAVAEHLKTDHHELYVTETQARDVIPDLPYIYDEPFSDSSQIPTFLVSKLARENVTVALSGDGGDELFAGYTRYTGTDRYARSLFAQPKFLRNAEAAALRMVSPSVWNKASMVLPASRRPSHVGHKAHKLAELLSGDFDDLYRRLVSHWDDPGAILSSPLNDVKPHGVWDRDWSSLLPDRIAQMQFIDTLTYLPDDILTKVDRASMANSLEARVPLIDHRVVSLAWRLPKDMKIGRDGGKSILRSVLARYVPRSLFERPKMGFGVPIGAWLRGPLREWAEDLLSEKALKETGYFMHEPIRQTWQEHVSGVRDWQYLLWDILMVQAWEAAQDPV
jgi:asparagine synthase (glutamine-hydrolysing)